MNQIFIELLTKEFAKFDSSNSLMAMVIGSIINRAAQQMKGFRSELRRVRDLPFYLYHYCMIFC